MKYYLVAFAFLLFGGRADAQQKPLATSVLMKDAYSDAAKEKKNVFLLFTASWCGWCHKMDTAMNDEVCKKLFTDNYVIIHLDVLERKGKEILENPGSLDALKKYHGDDQGIPFWLILNPDGKLLADSKKRTDPTAFEEKGENIGCPVSPEEVSYFLTLLKKTSSLDDSQLETIGNRFRKIQ